MATSEAGEPAGGTLLSRHRSVMPSWLAIYYDEPIEIVRGKGRRVTDATGAEYLDFFAGILTNGIGYDIAEISDAIRSQVDTGILHTSTLYLLRQQVELAEKLARLSGIPDAKVFLTNSGTEVIETTTAGDVACLIAEPIQGVGGFSVPPPGLYAAFKEVLDEYGILFVSDEVQTAWGRTGAHFWGIGSHGVTPDAITFAKGLANGIAIGGVIARPDLMDCFQANSISTFGGNPIACTAANAALDYLLDHDLQGNAAQRGSELMSGLKAIASGHDVVGDVRGMGLMVGVEFVEPDRTPSPAAAARLLEETKARGLLVGKGGLYGNVIRMSPPMTVTADEVAEALGILEESIVAVQKEITA